jgi:2-polyprenyl-6-methoxyphenol hydroxylase-like FAD-dependent oxidoreductase
MAKVEKVLVVGAGIGGLAAAAALGQRGAEVDMAEVKPDSTVYGVGINQPANSLRALDKIGVLEEILDVGVVYDGYTFNDYKGNEIVAITSQLGDDRVPANCALPRRELSRILIGAAEGAGAKIRYGTTVEDLDDRGDSVAVTLTDGSSGEYDLVVGFDGIKSPLRSRLFGDEYQPVYSGHVVWRLTVPRPDYAVRSELFQSPRSKGGYIPLTEDTMYLLLVTSEPEGVHYDPADFPDMLRERLSEYEGPLGEIREIIKEGDDIVYSPLSEVLLPPPWHKGLVVLGGDAAHACTPHITQGAGMALEDAVVLDDELAGADSIPAALQSYAERRYPRAKFVQEVSRGILESEMAINEETLVPTISQWPDQLPGQFAHVDAVLDEAA